MSDEATAAPEWCVKAAEEIARQYYWDALPLAAIIARHAPEPASQALAEALEEGVNALMIASAVFAVWGDKFAPGTTEMFRGHEKAFLKAAALASTRSATETPTPTAPSLRR